MNGSLITKYHNNGKKLPRGRLGRNCTISDHFREERLVGGEKRGLNALEKMSCLSTDQLYRTSSIPSFLTSSISSAIHWFLALPFIFISQGTPFSASFSSHGDKIQVPPLGPGMRFKKPPQQKGTGILHLRFRPISSSCSSERDKRLLFLAFVPFAAPLKCQQTRWLC